MKFRDVVLSFLVNTAVSVVLVSAEAGAPNIDSVSRGIGGGQYTTNYDYSQQQGQQSIYGQPVPRSQQGGYSYQQQGQRHPQQEGQGQQYRYDETTQREPEPQVQESQKSATEEEAEYQEGGVPIEGGEDEPLPPLPEGWSEFMDAASGRPYYYHAENRITTWTRPLSPPVGTEIEESNGSEESLVAPTVGEDGTDSEVVDLAERQMDTQLVGQDQQIVGGVGGGGVVSEEYGATDLQQQRQQQPVVDKSDNGQLITATDLDPSANVVSEVGTRSTMPTSDVSGADESIGGTNALSEEVRHYPYSENEAQSQQQGWGLAQQQPQETTKQHALEAVYYGNEVQPKKEVREDEQQQRWKPPTSILEEQKLQQTPPQSSFQYGTTPQQAHNQMEQRRPIEYSGGPPNQQQQQDPRMQQQHPRHLQQQPPSDYYRRPQQQPPPQQQQQPPPYYRGPPRQGDGQRQQPPPSEPHQQQQRQWGKPALEQQSKQATFVPQQPPQRTGHIPPPQENKPVPEVSQPGRLSRLWGKVSSSSDENVKPVSPASGTLGAVQDGGFASPPAFVGGTRMAPPTATGEGRNPNGQGSMADPSLVSRAQGSPGGSGAVGPGPGPARGAGGMIPSQQPPTSGGLPQTMGNPPGRGQYPPSSSWQQQQQQQPPPGKYGSQYGGMYGQQQYQQQQGGVPGGQGYDSYSADTGAINSQGNEPSSTLKDSVSSAWQGVIGFGNKTKTVVGQATETVVQSASQVSENVGTTGLGVWGRVKASAGTVTKSLFDSSAEPTGPNNYSLSLYSGQPPIPGQLPQQQQYPPQNYGGYPPGPGYPGPRQIQPYPHQGGQTQQQQQSRGPPGRPQQRPPVQSQWGDQHGRRQGGTCGGPGPAPQGQFRGRVPGEAGQPGPEGEAGRQAPPPQQRQQQPSPQGGRLASWDSSKEQGRDFDPSAHPGWTDGY